MVTRPFNHSSHWTALIQTELDQLALLYILMKSKQTNKQKKNQQNKINDIMD